MIIGYEGPFGSGKTLYMTARLHRRFLSGVDVLTNYALPFQTKPLDGNEMEKQSAELSNVAIGIDEIHVWMDSRSSMSAANKALSYFILQTRKRNVWLHYTTQDFGQVDLRIRRNTDRLVICRKIGKDKFYYRIIDPRTGKLYGKCVINGKKYYHLYNTKTLVKGYK